MTYSDMLLDAGYKQAAMCNNDSVTYINCLVACVGIRQFMLHIYNGLVGSKRIPKIENLPVEEKNSLWEQTKEFANNTLNLPETIKLSKCLYALEYLLN